MGRPEARCDRRTLPRGGTHQASAAVATQSQNEVLRWRSGRGCSALCKLLLRGMRANLSQNTRLREKSGRDCRTQCKLLRSRPMTGQCRKMRGRVASLDYTQQCRTPCRASVLTSETSSKRCKTALAPASQSSPPLPPLPPAPGHQVRVQAQAARPLPLRRLRETPWRDGAARVRDDRVRVQVRAAQHLFV